MISEERMEAVIEANDIVKVIGSYVPLEPAGKLFKGRCPFHDDKTPSFMVHPHRRTFHCFGCGAGGSVFRFLMNYKDISFKEAFNEVEAANAANGGESVRELRP
jgi:DNA primase